MLWASTLGGRWALYKSLLLLSFNELRLRLKTTLQRQFHFHFCVDFFFFFFFLKQTCSTAKLFATVVRTGPNHGQDRITDRTESLTTRSRQGFVGDGSLTAAISMTSLTGRTVNLHTDTHQSWSRHAHSPTLCGQVDRVGFFFLILFYRKGVVTQEI